MTLWRGVQLESKIIAKWNVTKLVVYIGVQQRKNPTSRYCQTYTANFELSLKREKFKLNF